MGGWRDSHSGPIHGMNGTGCAEDEVYEEDLLSSDNGTLRNGLGHISEEESLEDIFIAPRKAGNQCKPKNGATISPKIEKNEDYLQGSFRQSSRVNGVKGQQHMIDNPLEESEEKGARPRYLRKDCTNKSLLSLTLIRFRAQCVGGGANGPKQI